MHYFFEESLDVEAICEARLDDKTYVLTEGQHRNFGYHVGVL